MIIRIAEERDAAGMVAVLNPIIARGGTTAYEEPYDNTLMLNNYISNVHGICCHVAEEDGVILGFQKLDWLHEDEREGWGSIASFVAGSAAGKGIGYQIFNATKAAAVAADATAIDATIRADNVPGLRYYGGLGFVEYDRIIGVPLNDGTPVDRVRKRYDLTGV